MKKKILIALTAASSLALAQVNGEIDSSFATDGIVAYDNNQYNDVVGKMVIGSNGEMYLAGYTSLNGVTDAMVMALKADGTLDGAFGTAGIKQIEYTNGEKDKFRDLAILPNGKILAVGETGPHLYANQLVAVLNSDGSHYGGFNQSGYLVNGNSKRDAWNSCVALANGKILVGGLTSDGGGSNVSISKFNADGSPDISFNLTGNLTFDNAASEQLTDLHEHSATKYYGVIKENTHKVRVMAFNQNGVMDVTFGNAGSKRIDMAPALEVNPTQVLTDSLGRVYVIGNTIHPNSKYKALVMRFLSTGELDSNYAINGIFEVNLGSTNANLAQNAVLLDDGTLLLSGLGAYNNTPTAITFRVATDGSLIFNHGQQGVYRYNITGTTEATALNLAMHPNGSIFGYCSTDLINQADFTVIKLKGKVGGLGVNESIVKNTSINAYPNPAQAEINLNLENFEGELVTINVYTTAGQILQSWQTNQPGYSLSLGNLSTGMYLLTANSPHKTAQLKFTKK